MTLNAGIILGGQTPDILGAMDKGRAMAESQINLNRQNALAELYRTQGAQIAAGDQAALNALAQFDPNASLGCSKTGLASRRSNRISNSVPKKCRCCATKASARPLPP